MQAPLGAGAVKKTPRPARRLRGGNAANRIGAASLELASGISEAASAAAQRQQSILEIARGADEAASAAQQSSGLIAAMGRNFAEAREQTEGSRRRAEQLQTDFIDTNVQIGGSIATIELNAERQLASVEQLASDECAMLRSQQNM